jgi:DNA repair exonuclease SbcCD ATPase subunit
MKYLSIPDFHFSPNWADVSLSVAARIKKAAIENNVSFIAFVGDMFDAPIINTDKGGINIIKSIIKDLLTVCPVCVIEGTPSHDGPGCYGFLEDLSVTILKPNHTYGFSAKSTYIYDVNTLNIDPECIIFGVPELSKKNVQAKLALSATEATSKTLEYFKNYVESYIAPMRYKYSSLPAFGFLHGNISDSKQENNSDIIIRSSDLIIYTEDLRPANLTRWEFGHIHTPWESTVINGGYAGYTGIDSRPWGKRDFVPAMNMIDDSGKVERIPYSTPMRVKISKPLESYSPNIAYWLNTKDPKAELPMDKVHPWSRTTYVEDNSTTRRVTEEEAREVKSLSDLLVLLDPEAPKKAIELIDTIPEYKDDNKLDVDVKLLEVEVKGCKFFGSKTMKFDLRELNNLTSIYGDNGSGKSSLLSFCTPYPIIVGKDTQNRVSAISEFFDQKDSSIRKEFIVNGHRHEHLINIKGAHTKSAKNECYLTIDGVAQLDKGSFDEMLEMCEKLYGSFSDYILTSFYVQPLQSNKLSSGLMSASIKDVRNLVQNIAGIDRSKEKAYALAKALELSKEITEKENWLIGFEESLADIEELESEKMAQETKLNTLKVELKELEEKGKALKSELESLQAKKPANDLAISQKEADKQRLSSLRVELFNIESSISDIQNSANNADEIRNKIETSNANYVKNNSINSIIAHNSELQNKYNKELRELENKLQDAKFEFSKTCNEIRNDNDTRQREYVNKVNGLTDAIAKLNREYEAECNNAFDVYNLEVKTYEATKQRLLNDIENQELNIKGYQKQIEIANKPCSKCGHIEDDLQATIDLNNERIEASRWDVKQLKDKLNTLIAPAEYIKPEQSNLVQQYREEYANLVKPVAKVIPKTTPEIEELERSINGLVRPVYADVPEMLPTLSDSELQALQNKLNDISLASTRVVEYQAKKANILAEIAKLEQKDYNINLFLNNQIELQTTDLEVARERWSDKKTEIAQVSTSLDGLLKQISDLDAQKTRINEEKMAIENKKSTYQAWDYIAKMLNPNKIPALELEMILSFIDAEATRIISVYQEGRFGFKTVTQNSNGTDKFDIEVYDSMTGDSRSYMKFSPGQKAFFADAYTKALVRERNSNGTRIYSPVIMDESDGPLQPELVGDYYNIQANYWDLPVLIVSHSPASHEFIEDRVEIKDLIG